MAPGAPVAKFMAASKALDALIEAEGHTPDPVGWTDDEIVTFLRRAKAFTARKMPPDEAERLAESMLMRDRPDSGDDRRICLECRQFKDGACQANIQVPRTILQRCDSFSLKGAA
jgi:hypothetical protein